MYWIAAVADRLVRLGREFHHDPFGPAAYGARQMQMAAAGVPPGSTNEVSGASLRVQRVDLALQALDLA